MNIASEKQRRRTVRIPVIATLTYRAVGMDDFEMCPVSNVSTLALEMHLDHVLPKSTVVTISVRSGESDQQYHHVVGQVTRIQQRKGKWMHVVAASAQRPWSPLFIYDVVCSTFDPAMKNPVAECETKPRHAELEEWFNLVAWEATVVPERPIGLETAAEHASLSSAWEDDFIRADETRWCGIPRLVN